MRLERLFTGVWILTIAAAMMFVGGCEKSPSGQPQTQPAENRQNEQYISALAVANEFCAAWKQGSEAAGRALMSKRMIRTFPDAQLRDAIVGASNPAHAAFQIGEGKKRSDGGYEFPIVLFFRYGGQHSNRIEAADARIVVAEDQPGLWRVAEFPMPQTQRKLDRARQ